MLRHLTGGLDLAFEWAGGTVKAMCEINPFCQKVLRKHWPNIHIFTDIHKLTKEAVQNEGILPAIDIIYGGFPCQPFSVAGDQKGKDDARYLWPEFSRLVREFKPRWILAENVPGILRIAADDVCSDLERQGYSVGIWDFEAAAVGAKHRRERVFFVAHSGRTLQSRSFEQTTLPNEAGEGAANQLERPGCSFIANSDSKRCQEQRQSVKIQQEQLAIRCNCGWQSEPEVGRVAYGIPHRVDRLRALGNAVVPQQVYPIFKAIIVADKEAKSC
ncbi:MAG: DNA cytosine methyltransferase [Synergistaceae bacterium]|nr:DNA cytosine methyltransferase [Synergistaceae bacterium]